MINKFAGQYFFLSNFYSAPVVYGDICYKNSEAAFQAQKTLDISQREAMADMSPEDAKRAGRSVDLRSDWDAVKFDVMYGVCKAKFTQNYDLRQLLLDTGSEPLEEGNTCDRLWGTVDGVGENHLGKVLMRIRDELRGEL